MSVKNECIITVDIGATWTRIGQVGGNGIVSRSEKVLTPHEGFQSLIDKTHQVHEEADACIRAVVFGVPGPVDYAKHRVVKLPNLPRWDVEALSTKARGSFEFPGLLANDADLCALGEHRFGAGRDVKNMVFVSCGSGVGAGVILHGELVSSQYSLAEIGHAVIDLRSRQAVEQLGSGLAFERLTCPAEESGAVVRDADDMPGLSGASAAFALCVRSLALCFMPDRIVIGGGCANRHPEFFDAAREEIEQIMDILPLKPGDIVRTELGDKANIMGGYPFWQLSTCKRD